MVISNPKRMSVALGTDHFIIFSLLNIPGMSLVCMPSVDEKMVKSYPDNHESWLVEFTSHPNRPPHLFPISPVLYRSLDSRLRWVPGFETGQQSVVQTP